IQAGAHLAFEATREIELRSRYGAMSESRKMLFERLFSEQRGALQVFFRRRPSCRLDAKDLAQEVYLRMLRVTDTNAILDLEAYLFGVASNVAKEHAFQESRHGTTVDIDDATVQEQIAELPGSDGQIDTEQRIARLREVLRQL